MLNTTYFPLQKAFHSLAMRRWLLSKQAVQFRLDHINGYPKRGVLKPRHDAMASCTFHTTSPVLAFPLSGIAT